MDLEKQYREITAYVKNRLIKELHGRHLEDCIQHVAMECFSKKSPEDFARYGLKGSWDWYFANYCRANGLNRNGKSKQSAMTLEMSSFVGLASDADGDPENFALMERAIYENQKSKDDEAKAIGSLEEILSPIFKNEEIFNWAMSYYKKGRYKNER